MKVIFPDILECVYPWAPMTHVEKRILLCFRSSSRPMPRIGTAADLSAMALPPPKTEGGKPLMEALKHAIRPANLPIGNSPADALESALGCVGINRPQSGLRTAPSSQRA